MPQEITKEDGSKETVFTQAELDAEKAAATEAQTQLSAKEAELAKAKEDLARAGDKDQNFGQLRQKVDAIEKEKAELAGSIDTRVQSALVAAAVQEGTQRLAGGDKDLEAKLTLHYGRLSASAAPKSREEAVKLLRDAYTLATQGEPTDPDPLGSVLGSSGGGYTPPPSTAGGASATLNSTQLKVGSNLGISAEDATKYPPGSVPTQTNSKK